MCDYRDSTCVARLTQSLSAVEASWTTTNNDIVRLVGRVALCERHRHFARQAILWDLDIRFSVSLNDWERWDTIKAWGILRLASDDREASSVCRAQDFIVKEHTVVQWDSEVGAEVASRVELALVASYEHFLVVCFSNLEHLHLTLCKLVSERNEDLSVAFTGFSSSLLALLLQIESRGSSKSSNCQCRPIHEGI